mmetsp:Transcript_9680/g.21609  ORF Transcript_9680/g.21609 Transcript_9680/m.21609 type:complete len:88 (-) Transcript_9680:587-850(-)
MPKTKLMMCMEGSSSGTVKMTMQSALKPATMKKKKGHSLRVTEAGQGQGDSQTRGDEEAQNHSVIAKSARVDTRVLHLSQAFTSHRG